jgi:hypothetical protein
MAFNHAVEKLMAGTLLLSTMPSQYVGKIGGSQGI